MAAMESKSPMVAGADGKASEKGLSDPQKRMGDEPFTSEEAELVVGPCDDEDDTILF